MPSLQLFPPLVPDDDFDFDFNLAFFIIKYIINARKPTPNIIAIKMIIHITLHFGHSQLHLGHLQLHLGHLQLHFGHLQLHLCLL